jgi:hypothetical protein
MPLTTPSPQRLLCSFHQSLDRLRSTLLGLDVQGMARRSGFLRRSPRKVDMAELALALVAVGAESRVSLERMARVIGLAARTSYSKQALHKRLRPEVEPFLAQVALSLFGSWLAPLRTEGWLAPFRETLI